MMINKTNMVFSSLKLSIINLIKRALNISQISMNMVENLQNWFKTLNI